MTLVGALTFLCSLRPALCASASADAYSVPFEQWSIIVVITGVAGLAATINFALGIWDKIKPKPPLHVQFAGAEHEHNEYVRRGECHDAIQRYEVATKKLDGDINALRSALTSGFTNADDADERRASKIYERIEPMSTQLSELKGRLDEHIRRKGPHAHD